MRIVFDSADEYTELCEMLNNSYYYWRKRYQEAQGKICMTLDDKGVQTTSHYTVADCLHEMESVMMMMDVVACQTHMDHEFDEVLDDWVEVEVAGEAKTYVTPIHPDYLDDDDTEEVEVEEVVEEVVESKMHLNPRPNLQTDMIEWMSRPEYALARWNLGYKVDKDA